MILLIKKNSDTPKKISHTLKKICDTPDWENICDILIKESIKAKKIFFLFQIIEC